MRSTPRLLVGAAGAAAVALLLAGCSGGGTPDSGDATSDELTPVTLQLQWLTQAQFGGYYLAAANGYWEDLGLDVEIIPGAVDIVPQDVLAAGDVDFAIAWVPKALASIEGGSGITNIAQIFERSGTLQVSWADSGLETPADLSGKTIGSWGYGNEWELFAGLTEADATDYTIVQQNFDMNALLSKEIDAAQAMTYNEYAQLLEATDPETGELYQPEDFTVIDWNEVGTAMLQDAIWANAERLESDTEYQDIAVKLIQGAILGWIDQRDDPQAAADAVTAAGSTLGTSHQLWMANEINKLIWPSTSGIGHINEDQWDATVSMALETKNQDGAQLITADPPASAYTNEYVDKALEALRADGVDVDGADFKAVEVELQPGGE
ncbi:NitT/TauT family transport system substrate-binding protein [Microbacterium trichothecenolyticum]|uniref:ABC transporter substrate-binding protein n=1 Tax=Microbacterium trichothecenolyticum TaxID=69370 RepID=UPI00285CFB33|nr:ABC transporter substrate-binding protein [Microbacterium trichothecenolyticum]MDR7184791.1 NitT/TauT family transport system substrate-binding protein [Microbacterium trichothecenolyticum]